MEEADQLQKNAKDLPTETLTLDPILQKKHASMLARLSNNHQSRLHQSAARRSSGDSSSPSFESLHSFLSRFSDAKLSIHSHLLLLRSSSDPIKPQLDQVSSSISDLEKLLSENSYFLPPYELRSSLKSIEELKATADAAYAEIAPRKRFSFKSKAFAKKEPPADSAKSVDAWKPDVVLRESPGFRNRGGEVLVKRFGGSEQEGDFSVVGLESCDVYLKGRCRALFVRRVKNCRVFVGPVMGSVLVEEVDGCLFVLAGQQIRIHEARECDFYLRVRSRPIVEDCGGVRFGPYRLFYEGVGEDLRDCGLEEETGNWGNVDDFRWLRAVQSPNWCLIPEEEFVHVRDVSDLEEEISDEK